MPHRAHSPAAIRRAASSCLAVTIALGGAAWLPACSKPVEEPTSDFKPAPGKPLPPAPKALEKEDTALGAGREAKTGDSVNVQYTGTLLDGTKFDSSYDHGGDPFKFTLGAGQVIEGWDEGVVGMKVGGKRRLRIPADLGYGERGSPPTIPPGAALVFDVELVSID
jgi:peptidylprolyl isomerase/FKBP-type peptidyl-prolyl cis-trans isomerase FkpA